MPQPVLFAFMPRVHLALFRRLQKGPWIYLALVCRTALVLSSSLALMQLRPKCRITWLPTVDPGAPSHTAPFPSRAVLGTTRPVCIFMKRERSGSGPDWPARDGCGLHGGLWHQP